MLNILGSIYNLMGINSTPNMGDLFGILTVIFFIAVSLFMVLSTSKKAEVTKLEAKVKEEVTHEKDATPKPVEKVVPVAPKKSWSDRLKTGLSSSRNEIWGKIGNMFASGIDGDTLEELEELLYSADIGTKMVQELIEALEAENSKNQLNAESAKKFLFTFLKNRMEGAQARVPSVLMNFDKDNHVGTKTIMVIGVNGAGKTTTIGKLATKLTNQGANVVVGACDTFRAAAVDQLQVWCDRSGATMVRAKEGTNPTGVAYDALQQAKNQNADYCILDTAGRLHTKGNLMEELEKTKRVLKKLDENAPDETILVIDAITGQNALRQADEFNKYLSLSGLIFTKCDGSSKAGSAISISSELNLPISYIGVGETVDDLDVFDLDEYLNALLDTTDCA